jgi:hypothetical protein
MLQSSIKAGAVVAFAIFTLVGPALAWAPISSNDSARLVIPIQNEENQEIWRDLETGETPPAAAVGNEGQARAPREWEKATTLIDCEKAIGRVIACDWHLRFYCCQSDIVARLSR